MAHQADPEIRRGLNQARGHIESILTMLTDNRSCIDLAQQLQAVESTVRKVKRALVEDHMQHCIADAANSGTMSADEALRQFKALTKYL
ncbi:MAG TPA: metal-sensing transcriptional repressor [Sphingomicrobium sp.]|nr:metal-sensing transcriptional repressor [Sphingomicrobium sp.]